MICCSTINHVCLDTDSADLVQTVYAWNPGHAGGERLSDHSGMAVDLLLGVMRSEPDRSGARGVR